MARWTPAETDGGSAVSRRQSRRSVLPERAPRGRVVRAPRANGADGTVVESERTTRHLFSVLRGQRALVRLSLRGVQAVDESAWERCDRSGDSDGSRSARGGEA